jgi:hypothetical protein
MKSALPLLNVYDAATQRTCCHKALESNNKLREVLRKTKGKDEREGRRVGLLIDEESRNDPLTEAKGVQ